MAAPSWDTSSRALLDTSNYAHTAPLWGADVTTAQTLTSSADALRIGWTSAVPAGNAYGGRRTYSSSVNLTDRLVLGAMYASSAQTVTAMGTATSNDGILLALFSSGGARRWKIGGGAAGSSPIQWPFMVDPSKTDTLHSSQGTFDITAVIAHEFHVYSATSTGSINPGSRVGSTADRTIYSTPKFAASATTRLGGEVGNVASFEPIPTLFFGNESISYAGSTPHPPGSCQINYPVRIRADLFQTQYFYFTKIPKTSTVNLRQIDDAVDSLFFDVPVSGSHAIDNSLYYGAGHCLFDTAVGAGGTLNITKTTISSWHTVNLNDCLVSGSLVTGSTIINLDNCDFASSTIDSPGATLNIVSLGARTTGAILSALTVNFDIAAGDYSAIELDLANDTAWDMSGGGGAYNLSGLTGGSIGNPVIFDAIDGEDYIITVGSGLVAEVADPVTSGTVNIIAPSVDFSAPNLADGAIYQILHRQTFAIAAAAVNTTTNEITLTTDTNGDAPDFDTTTSGRHTLCRFLLADGATIPAGLVNTGSYRVASLSGGAVTLELTEGGGAIDLTTTGTNNGGGVLAVLVFETLVAEGTVSGGGGASETLSLPDGAIYRFKAIHQDITGGPRITTRVADTTGAWSTAGGASFVSTVDALNSASDLWTEINRIALLSNYELEDRVIDNAGNVITNVNPVEDGADIGGLTFLLEGHGYIQINAGSVTKNGSSVNGAISGQDLCMWAAYQLGQLDNLYLASSTTVVLDGLSNAVIDNVEFEETSGDRFIIYGMNIRERDGLPIVSAATVGPVIPNVATRGNVGLTSVGSGLSTEQSTQLTALYNTTTAGTGATVFSTASLANAPSGGGASAADIADAVLDEALSGHTTAGTLGKAVADILEDTETTLPAQITDRTLPSGDYFDPDTDTVARVTLVDTTTTNTDMRGTNGAITSLSDIATATNVSDAQAAILAAGAGWVTADISELLTAAAYTASIPANFADLAITETTGLVTTANPGGGGDDAATIYNYFTDSDREDLFKATGFATPADITDAQTAILTQGNSAWTTATGFSTLTSEDIATALADYTVPTLAQIEAAGFTTTRHNALLAAESAARAVADGRHKIDYAASTATQYNADGSVRTVFDLLEANGSPATSGQNAVERVPQ
jgi:hypothetical protein